MPTYIIEVRLQIEADDLEHAEHLADALDYTDLDLRGVAPIVYVDNVRPITGEPNHNEADLDRLEQESHIGPEGSA